VAILSVAVNSDDQFLISASRDKSIKVFDLHTKQEIHHFQNAHKGKIVSRKIISRCLDWITSVAVTSDNRYIVSGSFDKSLKIFDLQTKQEIQGKIYFHLLIIFHLLGLVSEKGKLPASDSSDKSAKIFDLQSRQQEFGNFQKFP